MGLRLGPKGGRYGHSGARLSVSWIGRRETTPAVTSRGRSRNSYQARYDVRRSGLLPGTLAAAAASGAIGIIRRLPLHIDGLALARRPNGQATQRRGHTPIRLDLTVNGTVSAPANFLA